MHYSAFFTISADTKIIRVPLHKYKRQFTHWCYTNFKKSSKFTQINSNAMQYSCSWKPTCVLEATVKGTPSATCNWSLPRWWTFWSFTAVACVHCLAYTRHRTSLFNIIRCGLNFEVFMYSKLIHGLQIWVNSSVIRLALAVSFLPPFEQC
jgi:hypothetical protein